MEHKLWFMGTSYVPGEARTLIDNLEDSAHREMARAEFYYFRGESEKAAEISEKYLQDEDLVFRMSACLIYIFSDFSVSGSMPADVSAEYGGHKPYPALRSELLHTSVLK